MPREIPILHQQTPIDGVLISRKQLNRNRATVRLERQAQQHAQRLLRDAQRQAESLQQHAYQEGYQQGILCTMQQVASYLAASQTLAWSWRERLSAQARAMLSAAVDHPDTLLLLLDEWLRNLPEPDKTLYLTLPDTAHSLQPRLMDLLAMAWQGAIQLDYHTEPRFVMRYADQVAEFSPEQYVEPAMRSLQQSLETIPQDCRRISAHALHELIEQWQELALISPHNEDPL